MGLVLQPQFSDLARDEIEAHIEQVRARRMSAVVQYHAGVNAKLKHASAQLQQRIAREYHMVGKDIEKADKLDEKIQVRMQNLEILMSELESNHDRMIPMEGDNDE